MNLYIAWGIRQPSSSYECLMLWRRTARFYDGYRCCRITGKACYYGAVFQWARPAFESCSSRPVIFALCRVVNVIVATPTPVPTETRVSEQVIINITALFELCYMHRTLFTLYIQPEPLGTNNRSIPFFISFFINFS